MGNVVRHLPACVHRFELGERVVTRSVRADCHERVGGKLADLIPVHDEFTVQCRGLEAAAVAQGRNGSSCLVFGVCSQGPIDLKEGTGLFLVGTTGKMEPITAYFDVHTWGAANGNLKREPPKVAFAIGEVAWHINGHEDVVLAKDWIGVISIVAVAIIKGEDDERFGVFTSC